MKVLICSERFLPRFGADRVLVLLGQRLAALGHHVVWVGVRFDRDLLAEGRTTVVQVPADGVEYRDLDTHTARWLRDTWHRLEAQERPALAIVGGWPFYTALPFLREQCPVVAVDFGAVPLDGFSGPALAIQVALRELRSRHLERASLIVAISRFIAESQSVPDGHGRAPVKAILLGADHMEAVRAIPRSLAGDASSTVEAIRTLQRAGKKVVLSLGRWEPGGYKNSEAAFEILRSVRARVPECVLVVLAPPADVLVPADLTDAIVLAGFPGDAELAQSMALADLGVSVSLWEGFNLPLAEMQWLGRPALVFDCGAHPEVVADPWFLCRDAAEMADKAVQVLSSGAESPPLSPDAIRRFRRRFRWDRFFQELLAELGPLTGVSTLTGATRIAVDVTNSTRDPANTGVIRVTRRLCRELQNIASLVFVVWDEGLSGYVFPTSEELSQLGAFGGPVPTGDVPRSPSTDARVPFADSLARTAGPGPWCLMLTETVPGPRVDAARELATRHGVLLAAIFYDAIPVLWPELCPDPHIRANHGAYMRALAACDLVLPISAFSARCLDEYWDRIGVTGGAVVSLALPGELSAEARPTRLAHESGPVRMLCVSTLEPRKNHATLIAACRLLDERFPGLDWSLTLVGNRYAGASDIAETIESVSRTDRRIQWLGVVSDEELAGLYRQATFTVYPSLVEGYGLPILESVWAGTPCICRDQGVMAELAAGGGCLTVDVSDATALCDAIGLLATDAALRRELGERALARPLETWTDYAGRVAMAVLSQRATPRTDSAGRGAHGASSSPGWLDVLYPRCLLDDWQQEHSERLAIAAVLARHRPACSIEIGTFRGGSLSLIRQHSSLVFSIDIEPVGQSLRTFFPEVTFLHGPSSTVLPILFRELDAAGISPGFILVDGSHTAEGVTRDIECILDYSPAAPMFVLLHDSFNPGCRQGIAGAPWARSRHVHWVDLDFVPGRVVENGGAFDGQMWGGLAMAYLTPDVRTGDLVVYASANRMFERLRQLQYGDG